LELVSVLTHNIAICGVFCSHLSASGRACTMTWVFCSLWKRWSYLQPEYCICLVYYRIVLTEKLECAEDTSTFRVNEWAKNKCYFLLSDGFDYFVFACMAFWGDVHRVALLYLVSLAMALREHSSHSVHWTIFIHIYFITGVVSFYQKLHKPFRNLN
jgi:hypothetical protein